MTVSNVKRWSLTPLESTSSSFQGEPIIINFPPEDWTYSPGGAEIAEFGSYGMPYPVLQWVRGLADEITFRSLVWHHDLQFIIPGRVGNPERSIASDGASLIEVLASGTHTKMKRVLSRLIRLASPSNIGPAGAGLPRGPVCQFSWSLWSFKCLVQKISDIQPISINSENGHPLGYRFSVTLKRYVEWGHEVNPESDLPKPPGVGTRFVSARERDTYEIIAQAEFGNALFGVHLRRLQPRKPYLQPEDQVKIPELDWITRKASATMVPNSPILRPTTRQRAIFEDLFEARSITRRIIIS